MTRLANFSVENENSILLRFLDGTHIRIHPTKISQHLAGEDLERVKRALKLRKHFIDNVLPPGAAALLIGAVLALGVYDAHYLADMAHKSRPAGSAVGTTKSSPKPTLAESPAMATKPPETNPSGSGVENQLAPALPEVQSPFNFHASSSSAWYNPSIPGVINLSDKNITGSAKPMPTWLKK